MTRENITTESKLRIHLRSGPILETFPEHVNWLSLGSIARDISRCITIAKVEAVTSNCKVIYSDGVFCGGEDFE